MDGILSVLQAFEQSGFLSVAFTIWALVVWHLGRNIIRRLDSLNKRMIDNQFMLGNRVTKIEGHLENKDETFRPYKNGGV